MAFSDVGRELCRPMASVDPSEESRRLTCFGLHVSGHHWFLLHSGCIEIGCHFLQPDRTPFPDPVFEVQDDPVHAQIQEAPDRGHTATFCRYQQMGSLFFLKEVNLILLRKLNL